MGQIIMRAHGGEVVSMYYDFTEEIEHGVKWLDENVPGWVDRIDLDLLDMDNPRKCILGQLFRDRIASGNGYEYAMEHLDLFAEDALWGFDFTMDVPSYQTESAYARLTAQWTDVILYRRSLPTGLFDTNEGDTTA